MNSRSDIPTSNRKYCPLHGKMARNGSYFRESDSKYIERWRCLKCGKTTSQATGTLCFGQNKRRLNFRIFVLLASGVSQRRIAFILGIDKNTVAAKLKFLGIDSKKKNDLSLQKIAPQSIQYIQLDEMETFEHTKLKPLSIAVAVCPKTRLILGAEVSIMPARGPMASKSVKKYGKRPDGRKVAMKQVLENLKPVLSLDTEITSDKNPKYPKWIKDTCSSWKHKRVKGRKPCHIGQGELKEGVYDPLFYLNHTCAMIRDSVKRLARKNWCTTKKLENLQLHLEIYRLFHNTHLLKK